MKNLKRVLSLCLVFSLAAGALLLGADGKLSFGKSALSKGGYSSGDSAAEAKSLENGGASAENLTPSERFLSMTAGGEVSPVIIVPGINHSELYLVDENEPDGVAVGANDNKIQAGLLPLDFLGSIKSDIPKAVWAVAKVLFTQHSSNYFRNTLKEIVTKLFSGLAMDENAELINKNYELVRFNRLRAEFQNWHEKNPETPAKEFKSKLSKSEQTLPTSYADMNKSDVDWLRRLVTTSYIHADMEGFEERVGLDKLFFFTFSLYSDPITAAAELEQFVQDVKKTTGSDKVSFLNVSLGGTVFTSWADIYGAKNNYKDLDKVINAVAVLDGTNIVGDFFSALAFNASERKERYELNPYFCLSDEFLYSRLTSTFFDYESESKVKIVSCLVNSAIRLLPRNAVLDLLHEVFDTGLSTVMLHNPQMWAMVPSSLYPELSDTLLSDLPGVKEKTDRFYSAQKDLRQNVLDMVQSGVVVNNICGYNSRSGDVDYRFFSAVSSAERTNGDGVIDIGSTSIGALSVPVGQRLGYSASKADTDTHSYISPDGSVDASTCALPDNTWFFNKMLHEDANSNSATTNLITALICAKEPISVLDYPEYYPQFNESCNNKMYRRNAIAAAKYLLSSDEELSDEYVAQLNATVQRAKLEMQSTICNPSEVEDIKYNFKLLLSKYNDEDRYKIDSDALIATQKLISACDDAVMTIVGGQGFIDFVKSFINGKAYVRLIEEIKQAYDTLVASA